MTARGSDDRGAAAPAAPLAVVTGEQRQTWQPRACEVEGRGGRRDSDV
ncbi:MAG TPA: hypothetical protein VF070_41195 [Streptosporangiaceae bacterium]